MKKTALITTRSTSSWAAGYAEARESHPRAERHLGREPVHRGDSAGRLERIQGQQRVARAVRRDDTLAREHRIHQPVHRREPLPDDDADRVSRNRMVEPFEQHLLPVRREWVGQQVEGHAQREGGDYHPRPQVVQLAPRPAPTRSTADSRATRLPTCSSATRARPFRSPPARRNIRYAAGFVQDDGART